MAYEISALFYMHDVSDPLTQFVQIGITVSRDDGKNLSWRGERMPMPQEHDFNSVYVPLQDAIASAVRAMLQDRTVLEFVGQV